MAKIDPSFVERREYIRLDTVFPVQVRLLRPADKTAYSDWLQGFTRNISKGGICLAVNNLQPELAKYLKDRQAKSYLGIEMPISRSPVYAWATVSWLKEASAKGLKPKYDGQCRNLGLGPATGSVVRLKTPLSGITRFNDLVKGPISFDNEELDDLILRRSDGSPTYHLAVVADDINLGITHVIRGDDHVNNTPRQILIYNALEEPLPFYAHLPMILGPDKHRLSKRHGAMSVLAYRDMGYLPHALLNSLARLGWSHGDKEKFSREELIENFSIENVGKAAGVFNLEKPLDLNGWYIRESSDRFLAKEVVPFLERLGFENPGEERLVRVVAMLKVRSKTLVEMAEGARFLFQKDINYDEKGDDKFLKSDVLGLLEVLRGKLEDLPEFTKTGLEMSLVPFLEENGIKLKKIAQPLRVALTGKTASPGIFDVMELLGKDKVLQRLGRAITHIKSKQ